MAYGVSNVVRGSTVGYFSNSLASCFYFFAVLLCHYSVMLSRRGKSSIGLVFKLWPQPRLRPQTFGLGLASISSYYVIGHFSGKNLVKFGNFVILNRMLLIII